MKRAIVILAVLMMTGFAAAGPTAVIQPNNPDDVVLTGANGYKVTKSFDGSASSGNITSYSWNLVGSNQSDTGPTAEFTFDRSSDQSATIRLTVTNGSAHPQGTDVAEVSQTVRDEPEVSISASGSTDIKKGDSLSFTATVNDVFNTPITGYTWKKGNTQIGTAQNISYTFDKTGTFTITMEATDSAGDTGVSNSVSVSVTSDSSGGGGGGGTGGSGGSVSLPSAAPDMVDKLFGSIQPGTPATMAIDAEERIGVKKISISVRNPAQNVEITVSRQAGQPANVSTPETGMSERAYRYMEISASNINDTQLEEASITFDVNKSWIQDNSINRSTVTLKRYHSDQWERLPTTVLNETADQIAYEAVTSGFSYFAVTGDQTTTDSTDNQTQNDTTEDGPVCGDGVCDSGETAQTCPTDCKTQDGDGPATDNRTDDTDEAPTNEGKGMTKVAGIGIVLILVLAAIGYLVYQRKEEQDTGSDGDDAGN